MPILAPAEGQRAYIKLLVAWFVTFVALFASSALVASERITLPARSILWLSDANEAERDRSFDAANHFKLKSIQELAVMRFDTAELMGRRVLSARLFLKPARPVRVRYLRVSTVTRRWLGRQDLPPSQRKRASTWRFADAAARTPWAWPGSVLADVSMSAGNSLADWGEATAAGNGWLSVPVSPAIVSALAANISDGLAVADGGSIALANNYFHGSGTASRPYLEIDTKPAAHDVPSTPVVRVVHASESGAPALAIEPSKTTFGWHLSHDGKPVPQWRIPRPLQDNETQIPLSWLQPGQATTLSVESVSMSGARSTAVKVAVKMPRAEPRFVLPPLADTDQLVARDNARAPDEPRSVRTFAPHIKVSPLNGKPTNADKKHRRGRFADNHVVLDAARGEYVSFQLVLPRLSDTAIEQYRITDAALEGPSHYRIEKADVELFSQWYSRTRAGVWQPAYAVPLRYGAAVSVPDPRRALAKQQFQAVWVDVYVPKQAPPGRYVGELHVEQATGARHRIPIHLKVHDFVLPDRLSFWAELNTYRLPRRHLHAYFRVAHQNRTVFMPWVLAPRTSGQGEHIKLDFRGYDRLAGPLLSGTAFAGNRRASQPVRTMYLPFMDSWPTALSPKTYSYDGYWPRKGDSRAYIEAHYQKAPYIGAALSTSYKRAVHAAQAQFIEHFARRGWNATEMHTFYGGKNTHRIQYGSNMWWTTDEPYHWDDWLALQFFTRHWTQGLAKQPPRVREQFRARADISRPQWLGQVLDGGTSVIYFAGGNFSNPERLSRISQLNGIEVRAYGGVSRVDVSTTSTIAQMLWLWLNGANAFLPWQTLGNDTSLDVHDNVGGAAILIPGGRLGHAVLADLRLRAMRDAQQLVEYLEILRERRGLSRRELLAAIGPLVPSTQAARHARADDADALQSAAWPIDALLELRRRIAIAIEQSPSSSTKP